MPAAAPDGGTQPKRSERLIKAREEADYTQVDACVRAGISLPSLQRLEAGVIYNPGIRTLAKLANIYDRPVLDLCEPEWLDPTLGGRSRAGRG